EPAGWVTSGRRRPFGRGEEWLWSRVTPVRRLPTFPRLLRNGEDRPFADVRAWSTGLRQSPLLWRGPTGFGRTESHHVTLKITCPRGCAENRPRVVALRLPTRMLSVLSYCPLLSFSLLNMGRFRRIRLTVAHSFLSNGGQSFDKVGYR